MTHARRCTIGFYELRELINDIEEDLTVIKSQILIELANRELAKLYEEMEDIIREAEGFVAYD